MTSCGLRCRQVLLPHDRQPAPRTILSSSLNDSGLHWLNGLPLPEFSRLAYTQLTTSPFT
ncbi:hypothetical protein [Escherichia coli]|uniref:hypothetical protein n=1 Tax=Escherichia coli TaxID=562 RepID=UPI0004CF2CC7|nr:hypothetical protein [Escherichia coli]